MKTILVPIDFSPISKQVLAEAVQLSRAIGARLAVMHVVQPPAVTESDLGGTMSAEYSAMAIEGATKQLAKLAKRLAAEGIEAQTSHHVGFPGHRIVERADKLSADYIVLGSHGHGAFYELMVGSTTSRVLKRAKCPVVVVPKGAKPVRQAKAKFR
jgi:universal stress protein A